MTAEGQSDKTASDMEVRMKQRCVIESLHAEKNVPNDIHWHLLSVYGDQTVDVSTLRRWVACFSSGDSDVQDKPRSGRPWTAVLKSVLISSSAPISGLRLGNCVQSWILLQFSCNMITQGPIQVWRSQSILSSLAGQSYHTHRTVRIWHLVTSICLGRWKMDCVRNIFLATTPLYELWNSGPPPLEQIFMSAACRLLFIDGESA